MLRIYHPVALCAATACLLFILWMRNCMPGQLSRVFVYPILSKLSDWYDMLQASVLWVYWLELAIGSATAKCIKYFAMAYPVYGIS